ncbi:MAG: 5'/3'-nucleotidase SurE [Bacteroidota bacterium]
MKSTTKKKVAKPRSASKERVILITNDDGITAPGIRNLVEAMRPFGRVVIVAPDSAQSAKGHAITISKPLRLDRVAVIEGVERWQWSGTPGD